MGRIKLFVPDRLVARSMEALAALGGSGADVLPYGGLEDLGDELSDPFCVLVLEGTDVAPDLTLAPVVLPSDRLDPTSLKIALELAQLRRSQLVSSLVESYSKKLYDARTMGEIWRALKLCLVGELGAKVVAFVYRLSQSLSWQGWVVRYGVEMPIYEDYPCVAPSIASAYRLRGELEVHLCAHDFPRAPQEELGRQVVEELSYALAVATADVFALQMAEEIFARDKVTGLLRGQLLESVLETEIARATRSGTILGVTVVKVEGFERLADLSGFDSRDGLLARISTVLKSHVRSEDYTFRCGDAVFVILSHVGSVDNLASIRSRLQEILSSVLMEELSTYPNVYVRIGQSVYPLDDLSAQGLVSKAMSSL